MDLTYTEKAPYQREANNAAAPIQTAQNTFDNAEDEARKGAGLRPWPFLRRSCTPASLRRLATATGAAAD